MRPNVWPRALCVALISLAVTASFVCRPGKPTATPIPAGLYNVQQILNHAGPLCRTLAPEAGEMTVSADRVSGYLEHPYWNVTAMDRAHRDVVSLRWHDDTGELYAASHLETREGCRKGHLLTRQEVIEAARKWMRVLGFADQAPRWRLARPPQCIHAVWSMLWQAEGREAFVRVHAYTGSLVSSQTWSIGKARGTSFAVRGAGDRAESHHA